MDKDQACEMLAAALAMEDKGKAFYEKSARGCELEECRRIFERLAADEDLHKIRIQKIHDSLSADLGWCEWRDLGDPTPGLEKFMATAITKLGRDLSPNSKDVKALDVGIEMEAASIKYYSRQRDLFHTRRVKQFLAQLVQEEIVHYRALKDMKFYLEDPAGWAAEHPGCPILNADINADRAMDAADIEPFFRLLGV